MNNLYKFTLANLLEKKTEWYVMAENFFDAERKLIARLKKQGIGEPSISMYLESVELLARNVQIIGLEETVQQ